MATYNDDLSAIRTRFRTQWKTANPTVPFVYDNEPPVDEPTGIWVRLSVNPGAERRRSIASKKYEQIGRVFLQIMIPRTADFAGDEDAWKLADSFASIFRDWRSADYRILFDVPETRSIDTDEAYYIILVSVPYTAQH